MTDDKKEIFLTGDVHNSPDIVDLSSRKAKVIDEDDSKKQAEDQEG